MNLRIGAEQDVWKLLLVLAVGLVAVVAYPARLGYAQAQSLKVTLLGTGAPPPIMERFGPSIFVEAGGDKLVFDAGRGALQRLLQLKVPLKDVRTLFLTHLHSDHVVGIPDLWLTGWLVGRPEVPLRVWGPLGTKALMAHLEQAYQGDIRIRRDEEGLPPQGVAVVAEEITEGVVYEHNGVKVTAFEVDHGPLKPVFGYRIDYAGRSVVLSGDTRFSENLIRFAQGVDVVVHEVIVAEMQRARFKADPKRAERVIALHTTAEQAGEVFTRVKPKLAVYSHILPVTATANDLIPPTRQTYAGPLEVGEDLMVIDISDTVTVQRGMR
jgi:ribonuclease Z